MNDNKILSEIEGELKNLIDFLSPSKPGGTVDRLSGKLRKAHSLAKSILLKNRIREWNRVNLPEKETDA